MNHRQQHLQAFNTQQISFLRRSWVVGQGKESGRSGRRSGSDAAASASASCTPSSWGQRRHHIQECVLHKHHALESKQIWRRSQSWKPSVSWPSLSASALSSTSSVGDKVTSQIEKEKKDVSPSDKKGEGNNKSKKKKEDSLYKDTVLLPQTEFSLRANAAMREPEIQQYWKENGIYQKLLERAQKAGAEPYVLHDGPPYANGDLHIGHALNKILKDIINKYQTVRGRAVDYVPGWDCHGLPIELKVLQTIDKKERASMTPLQLRRRARDFALSTVQSQSEQFQRYGVWGNFEYPYMTLQPEYEAAQVGVFGKMVLNGHIYRGKKPVHWSPSSQTALAEAELEYPEGHCSRSVYVSFPLKKQSESLSALLQEYEYDERNLFLAIWTTTPWTLPANAAVAVNAKIEYSIVKDESGRLLVVAKDLTVTLAEKLGVTFETIACFDGATLDGCTYRHPLYDRESPVVIGGDYITTASGTGLVHTAPGHGQDDYIVGLKYDLPLLSPVDDYGKFTSEAGPEFEGLKVLSDGNEAVIQAMQNSNAILLEEAYEHKYPYDWRTKKPTIFRATEQWFASVERFRTEALTAIDTVKWLPEVGRNRIRGMTEDRGDWCISRQRTWGVPIPVFYHKITGEPLLTSETIEHVQNIFAEHGSDAWWEMENEQLLPANMRDEASNYNRGTDTMDVWFDSGTSWAGVVNQRTGLRLPADLYLEGSDQHRGWFQSSLLTSVAANGASPYKMVLTHGFVLDERGTKMSKSLGNVVDPRIIIEGGKNAKAEPAYGADVLRLWVSSVDYSSDVLIGKNIIKQVAESYRKLRGTLRFLLGNLYDFDPACHIVDFDDLPKLDRYMIDRLASILSELNVGYESFQLFRFSQALQNFVVNDLSTFYLDIAKDRLYICGSDSVSRRTCQTVLYHILISLLPCIAPVVPHLAEDSFMHIPFKVQTSHSEAALSAFELESTVPASCSLSSENESNFWMKLRLLRQEVNKALESARAEKMIGSALDSEVTLYVEDEDFRQQLSILSSTSNVVDRLDKIFIVSGVNVTDCPDEVRSATGNTLELKVEEIGSICIAVHKAKGTKCERCWHYSITVGQHNTHPTLCQRCVTIVEAMNMTVMSS